MSPPSLLKCVLLFFCFSPPDSALPHLLAAKWNLLHSHFLNHFKNMIVAHLLVQLEHSKKIGNKKRSARLTFSIRVKKTPSGLKSKNPRFGDRIISVERNIYKYKKALPNRILISSQCQH